MVFSSFDLCFVTVVLVALGLDAIDRLAGLTDCLIDLLSVAVVVSVPTA